MGRLGTTTAEFEEPEDKPGLELPLPKEVTGIAGIKPGDTVIVQYVVTDEGDTKMEFEFPETELTDEQIDELKDALQ